MQKKILAAIYLLVKNNHNIPLSPRNISGVTDCDEPCVERYFSEFEEEGYVSRKYRSMNIYTITKQGLIVAQEAYRQHWETQA